MRNKSKFSISIFGFFILILVAISCNQGPVNIADQIMEANKLFMVAVENGDKLALSNFYTGDAKLFPANGSIIDGQESIVEFWSATLGMGINKVLFETEKAEKYGTIAIEEGKYSLYVGGGQVVDQGKYVVTWKNEAGKWKVFRDIWNGNSTPPAQKATVNQNVLVVLNHVKGEKVAQFEDFYMNYLAPAGAAISPDAKKTVRVQKPTGPNKDGYFTYIL